MPARLLPPITLDAEDLQGIFDPFATERYAYHSRGSGLFAVALHRITGWQMVALDLPEHRYAHCGVRAPDGTLWDALGAHHSVDSFSRHFVGDTPVEDLREFTFAQLCEEYPNAQFGGEIAERQASMMFSNLPHAPTSDRARTFAFANALEELSRRNNLWICGERASHLWPVIGETWDGVAGYRVATNYGIVTLDRMLASDVTRGPSHTSHVVDEFLKGLVTLSQEHALWIRAGLPTTWPRLQRLDHQSAHTAHYALMPSLNGGGFLISAQY